MHARGFTLLETIIVLLLAGVVLAGVFYAAGSVSREERLNAAFHLKEMVVSNMRNLYKAANVNEIDDPTGNIMQQLDQAEVFPEEMQNDVDANDGVINHPLSNETGTVQATYILPDDPDPFLVSLTYEDVPPEDCLRLLTRSSATTSNLTSAFKLIINGTANTLLPMSPTDIEAQCKASATNKATITWHYRVRS